MAIALVGSMAATVAVGIIASAVPAAAATCTGDTWTNTAGGSWDTPSNWQGSIGPPTGTTAACITAPGTYTVTIGNETVSAGALTLGTTGSSPTLAIGNNGSGEPNVTFATVNVASGATLSDDWLGTFDSTGAVTNSGTVDVANNQNTSFEAGSFANQSGANLNFGNAGTGSGAVPTTTTFELPTSSSTLTNAGTVSVLGTSATIADIDSPSGQTATVTQNSGGVINNSGVLNVLDELSVAGGSLCGTPLNIGANGGSVGTLNFVGTVAAGPACGSGTTDTIDVSNIPSNGTLSGNVPSGYTVSIGNGGSSCATISASGAVTNNGTIDIGLCATLQSNSAFTNAGTLEVPVLSSGAAFSFTSFTNKGNFIVDASSTFSLPTSTSVLANSSTGTITVGTGALFPVTSPSGTTAAVSQAGKIQTSGTFTISEAVTVSGGNICNGPLYIGTDGGTIGSLTFAATVASGPACGTGPTDNIDFNNVASNGTFTGNIPAKYTVELGNGGSSEPNITINGAVTNLGTFEPGWGGTYNDTSTFTNDGTILIPHTAYSSVFNFTKLVNDGKFTVNSNLTFNQPATGAEFENASTGTLTVATGMSLFVGYSSAANTGKVVQAGAVTNSGTITVEAPLTLSGGSICGNKFQLGVDGQVGEGLTIAKKYKAGAACKSPLKAAPIFIANITGTIKGAVPKGVTVVIGDGGSSFAHVTSSATTNAGIIEPGFGATLTFSGALSNSGTLEFPVNAYTSTTIAVTGNLTNTGSIVADAGGNITVPSGDTITNTKTIKLAKAGTVVGMSGNLINNGTLTISATTTTSDRLNLTGTYSQGSTGKYVPGVASASEEGVLSVSGTGSLSGTIAPKLGTGYTPTVGATFTVLQTTGLGSTVFTTITGSWQVNYISSDSAVQIQYT